MTHSLKLRMAQSSQKTYVSPQFGDKFLKQLLERTNNYYCLFLALSLTLFPVGQRVQPAAETAPARRPTTRPKYEGRPLPLVKP